jgi:hypothetical protein
MSKRKKITEETEVQFTRYEQLSYYDNDEPEVTLFIDEVPVGVVKVWQDSEMNGREYICLNYEVVYLDCLNRTNINSDTGEIPWDLGTR